MHTTSMESDIHKNGPQDVGTHPAFKISLTMAATSVAYSLTIAADAITFPVWSTEAPVQAPATASSIPTSSAANSYHTQHY